MPLPRSLLLAAAALCALMQPAGSLAERVRPRPRTQRGPTEPLCTATLSVASTQGASGCFIDERVTRQPGTLRYPCNGGPAHAVFSGSRFVGTAQAGGVTLTLVTRFHYGDGCDWQSTQRITGPLAAGQLDYTYEEAPLPGQRGCARACRATATVTVSRR